MKQLSTNGILFSKVIKVVYPQLQANLCLVFFFHQFWDTRSPTPMMTLQLPERCYCADVVSHDTQLSAVE